MTHFTAWPRELLARPGGDRVTTITAVVPTLNRHDWVPRALDALLSQTRPPDEIVVVDQTPVSNRTPGVYDAFVRHGVRVFYLDRAGQSIARNRGIREARGEWIQFADDDGEVWPDALENHIRLVESAGVTASTGLSLAPWKTLAYLPEEVGYPQLATVFDTGNSLVRKRALLDVGCLDEAFDRGPGADHDLGVRLHLGGYEIALNPGAMVTHHKVVTGGLRQYGVWRRTKASLGGPFPPPTQVYTIQRYYPRRFWRSLYMLNYLYARRHHKAWELALLYASSPWKLYRAIQRARELVQSPNSSASARIDAAT